MLSPSPRSHTFRQRAGDGLKLQGLVWVGPQPASCLSGSPADPPRGPGHGFRVRSWDAEAGGWGPLGLACLALDHPGVRVGVVHQCILLTPQQLHLLGRGGGREVGRGPCRLRGQDGEGTEAQ